MSRTYFIEQLKIIICFYQDYFLRKRHCSIAFAIALELSLEETQSFLKSAGYTLSHSSEFDIIIEYFILQRNYNIHDINEALFDTIGHTINHIKKIHSYLRKKDIPQKVTFVIITDGMENSSRNYNKSEIKELIEFNKNQNGWEFIFIGANMDAMETASHIGINKNRSANYIADKKGTEFMYDTISNALYDMREKGEFDEVYMDVMNFFSKGK